MAGRTVGVVGGGAAGMTAAIAAAQQGARVTILERNDRVGRKLLMTGNGKCNLGNLNLNAGMYHGGDREWIDGCLARFGAEDTVRFFRGLGLLVKNKNGYLYPVSEQASVVLDVLRGELAALGVELVTDCLIDRIERREGGKFQVFSGDRVFAFDSIILACGGRAAPRTGSDGSGYRLAKQLGHSLVPVVPALVQLRCRETCMKAVAGVRAEGTVSVCADGRSAARETGEIQFTDYGISGIPVFQISRTVNYLLRERGEVEVVIDLMPDCDDGVWEQLCAGRGLLQADRSVEAFFTGMLNRKLMNLFIRLAGLKPGLPMEQADQAAVERVYRLCRQWTLHVNASNSFDNAQVCAGGVDTSQVTETMESRLCPGVYLVGELLDVDGRCGGYNLQWAWTSGYLAGAAAGMSPKELAGEGQNEP